MTPLLKAMCTEPLPPPSSNLEGERIYTVILSIKSITAFSDKQFCAAFMAVTVVTVLFKYLSKCICKF